MTDFRNTLNSFSTGLALLALAVSPAWAQSDDHPQVPGVGGIRSGVAQKAGTGGGVAFAEAGVLELGGSGSFVANDGGVLVGLSPSIGWFVMNNFELSLITSLTWVDPKGDVDGLLTFGVFAEPSLHLPLTNRFLVFGGVGIGAAFTEDEVGFALRPRVGFDILIGRSGIFRPAFDLTWSSSEVVNQAGTTFIGVQTSYGVSFGYHVMF